MRRRLHNALAAYREKREASRAIRHLSSFSDQDLRGLGIRRADIRRAVLGLPLES